MTSEMVLSCILGMFVVSYIPRVLPLFILSRFAMPPVMERWLRYVPTSVMGALVFSEVFLAGGRLNLRLDNISLWVSAVVLAVAVLTKSLGKSVVVGMGLFWFIKYML